MSPLFSGGRPHTQPPCKYPFLSSTQPGSPQLILTVRILTPTVGLQGTPGCGTGAHWGPGLPSIKARDETQGGCLAHSTTPGPQLHLLLGAVGCSLMSWQPRGLMWGTVSGLEESSSCHGIVPWPLEDQDAGQRATGRFTGLSETAPLGTVAFPYLSGTDLQTPPPRSSANSPD